jgi:hypothetical protein
MKCPRSKSTDASVMVTFDQMRCPFEIFSENPSRVIFIFKMTEPDYLKGNRAIFNTTCPETPYNFY